MTAAKKAASAPSRSSSRASSSTNASSARKTAAGSTIDLPSDGRVTVTRPDGEAVTVTGGQYVVQQAGTYLVDGKPLEVK